MGCHKSFEGEEHKAILSSKKQKQQNSTQHPHEMNSTAATSIHHPSHPSEHVVGQTAKYRFKNVENFWMNDSLKSGTEWKLVSWTAQTQTCLKKFETNILLRSSFFASFRSHAPANLWVVFLPAAKEIVDTFVPGNKLLLPVRDLKALGSQSGNLNVGESSICEAAGKPCILVGILSKWFQFNLEQEIDISEVCATTNEYRTPNNDWSGLTFPCICPVWAIWISIFSTILAFSGLARAMVFTERNKFFSVTWQKYLPQSWGDIHPGTNRHT